MSKKKKKDEKPKPKRVKCPNCGRKYDLGAPHAAFCRGTAETECEECSQENEDCFKCCECGSVSCPDCGDADEMLCATCKQED